MKKTQTRQSRSTKSEKIKALLLRRNGTTIAEMARSADWQRQSVRGFMSGTLKKKLGIEVTSMAEKGMPCGNFIARGTL